MRRGYDVKQLTLMRESCSVPLVASGGLDRMVRQTEDAWPHVFRTQQFVTGVQYLQMARARMRLMEETAAALDGIDVFVAPSFAPNRLVRSS